MLVILGVLFIIYTSVQNRHCYPQFNIKKLKPGGITCLFKVSTREHQSCIQTVFDAKTNLPSLVPVSLF